MPTSFRSWRAAWRRWCSKAPARARRNTTSPSAATTKCRSRPCSITSATRRDLDAARIGMWGVSLGGYYAPRAAAFDKRIKACIALGGPFNWGAAWDGLPELTREAFRVRSHCKTQEEARKNAGTLSLDGVARQHHLSDFHRERPARPHRAGQGRRAAGARGEGPGRADDDRGRQPHRHQPRLPLALAERRLDGGATQIMWKPRGTVCSRSIPLSVITTISPVCTPALPSRVTTLG